MVASASLHVSPVTTPGLIVTSGPENGQAAIDALIAPYLAATVPPSVELFKANANPFSEVGTLAGSYTLTYTPAVGTDKSGFSIAYDGGPAIDPQFLLVKDGNQDPNWYLFNISAWDGNSRR